MENKTQPAWPHDRGFLVWSLLAAALAGFALLTYMVLTVSPFAIDLQISVTFQSIDSAFFAGLMQVASWPGFLPQSILITSLIALILYACGLPWEAGLSLLAATLSGGVNQLIKELVQRPRPGTEVVDVFEVLASYSFPSGHVMFYTIVFGFTSYVVYSRFRPSLPRSLVLGTLLGLVLLVGASRIYLGQHWASDVLGAYLLGGVMLTGLVALYDGIPARFRRAALPEQ